MSDAAKENLNVLRAYDTCKQMSDECQELMELISAEQRTVAEHDMRMLKDMTDWLRDFKKRYRAGNSR